MIKPIDPKLDGAVAQMLGQNPAAVAQAVWPQLLAAAKGNGDLMLKALQAMVVEVLSTPNANEERWLNDTRLLVVRTRAARGSSSPIVVVRK